MKPFPMHFEAAQIEAGRILFAGECGFVAAVAELERMPPMTLPEVAFAGRSNVGKSSLINALTGRNSLARASNTPGRTRQLNFFDLAGRLLLVDMPGYGYAEAPKTEIARWTHVVESYLRGRVTLRRLCVLVDGRHGLKDSDRDLMDQLDRAAVSYQIVLTKVDKVRASERQALVDATNLALKKRAAALPIIAFTSSETGEGIAELRAGLAALAESVP